MKPHSRQPIALLTGLTILSASGAASAAAINIDIEGDNPGGDWWGSNGTHASTAAATGVGNTWNGFQWWGGFAPALVDDQGNATDIEMWKDTTIDIWAPPAIDDTLMGEYAFSGTAFVADTTNRFTLFTDTTNGGSGMALSGATLYDIYVYVATDTAGDNTTVQLNHAGGTSILSNSLSAAFSGTYTAGDNYVLFSGVSPKAWANGYEFEFFWGDANGGGNGAINGIQVVEIVPEPSVALLGGLGLLGLLRRRRY